MKAIMRNTMHPAGSATWQVLLAVVVLSAGCGARGLARSTWDAVVASGGGGGGGVTEAGRGGGTGGAGVGAGGGSGGSSSGGGASGAGGTGGAIGGATSQGGSAGGGQDGGATDGETITSPDALCEPASFWNVIRSTICGPMPLSTCFCSPTPDGVIPLGVVEVDSDGHIVDNTMLSGTNKQAWLDSLANQSWPCLAGQAVPYGCDVGL